MRKIGIIPIYHEPRKKAKETHQFLKKQLSEVFIFSQKKCIFAIEKSI